MRVTGSKKLSTYRLSIRVSADGFSLYIYKEGESKPAEQQRVPLPDGELPHTVLERALTRERLMELQYDTVEMVVDSPTTRIPLEEFQREDIEALYRLTFPETNPTQVRICYEILPYLEVAELFSVDRLLLDMVTHLFPEVQLHSLQGRILEDEAKKELKNSPDHRHMHVYRIPSGLFVYVLKRKRLHFACTYAPGAEADALYYVLHAWKVLQLDAMEDCCVLHHCNHLAADLGKYIKNIRICE